MSLLQACAPSPPAENASESPAAPATPAVAPVPLADWLPATLDGRDRQSLDQSRDGALGAEIDRVSARYGDGATLTVTDFRTADMAEMMGHGWALAAGAETLDGHPVQRDASAGSETIRVLVAGRFLVEVTAPTSDAALAVLRSADLARLAVR